MSGWSERYQRYKDSYLRAAHKYARTPVGMYGGQRRSALKRNIPWEFTLETWVAWWGDDLAKRGRKPHQLCMARKGDVGPYSSENTVKLTNRENREQYYVRRWGPSSRRRGRWANDELVEAIKYT